MTDSTLITTVPHPRLIALEALLKADGVPLEELKDAFHTVNVEVLRHAELVELMGAPEVGLVTQAAQRLLNTKLADSVAKSSGAKKSTAKTAKGKIAALLRDNKTDVDLDEKEEADDWGDL